MTPLSLIAWTAFGLGALTLIAFVVLILVNWAPWEHNLPAHLMQAVMPPIHPKPNRRLGQDGPIAIGSTVSGSGDEADLFAFNVGANKKLVLALNGPTSVLAGIWTGTEPAPPNGVLRVCGITARGCHLFKAATPCCIQVTNDSGGPYTMTLRSWNLLDYLTINSHKSTC